MQQQNTTPEHVHVWGVAFLCLAVSTGCTDASESQGKPVQRKAKTSAQRTSERLTAKRQLQQTKFINIRTGRVFIGKQYTHGGLIAKWSDGKQGVLHVTLRPIDGNLYVRIHKGMNGRIRVAPNADKFRKVAD